MRLTVRMTSSASPESRLPRLEPPSTRRPMPVARSRLDPRAVGGSGARREQAALLVHPAERGYVVVRAEQDPRLTRAGLRGEVGLPLGQPVRALGDPAGHVGCVPVPHRPSEHREREPVDLEVDDPGNVRCGSRRPGGGRFAGRRAAVYVSSSFVPKITSRTTLTAATRSAASSAQPKLSTTKVFSSRSEASWSTTALRIRTSTKPSASM